MTTVTTTAPRLPMIHVDLGAGARGVFTGRGAVDPPVGVSGNQSHHRAHRPDDLAAARSEACQAVGVGAADLVLMRQVHSGHVIDATDCVTPAELGPADALVSSDPTMALGVLTADCVPVLFVGDDVVGVAHAGREGLLAGVVQATLSRFAAPGVAAVGPAIRGCCYEVPTAMRDRVAALHPVAAATTTWGTPSLDLPAAVVSVLEKAGWAVTDTGVCTHHDAGNMSHRRNAATGRQLGLVRRVAA